MFHHAPPVVIQPLELGHEHREVDFPLTQFTENPLSDSLKVVPAILDDLLANSGMIILEMEVPDPLAISAKPLQGVSATKAIVTTIEY